MPIALAVAAPRNVVADSRKPVPSPSPPTGDGPHDGRHEGTGAWRQSAPGAGGAAVVTSGTIVVKVGSSSVTDAGGHLDEGAVDKLCGEAAELRADGHAVVLVTSGAIAAGWAALGGGPRPSDPVRLQALS